MFRAVRDYDGSETDKCITLISGDILSAVHAVDETWFIGYNERSGETGAFPIACVTDIQENGNDTTVPESPDQPKYANVSKVIQERLTESEDLDPLERSRTLSMKANTFDASRLRKTKPEKKFRLKLIKREDGTENSEEETAENEGQGQQGPEELVDVKLESEGHHEVFAVRPPPEQSETEQVENPDEDSGQAKVRFSNEALMHSVSVADSHFSWADSSFEMSDHHNHHHEHRNSAGEDYSKHADQYHKLDEKQKNTGIFKRTGNKLFKTAPGENRAMKGIFGAMAGVLIGGLLFLVLIYSFGYTYMESGIIVAIATVIMCVALATSSLCRCIMALVFPNFFTGKGRTVFLSVIFGIMLTHPIANITHNAQETGRSFACMTELAANQSRAIQKQLAVPFEEITGYIVQQREKLESITSGIQSAMNPIRKGLKETNDGIEEANEFLGKVSQECDRLKPIVQKYGDTCDSIPFLSSVCKPAHASLKSLVDECNKIDELAIFATKLAADETLTALASAVNYFRVDIEANAEMTGDVNISKPVQKIQEEVTENISAKAQVFEVLMYIFKKFLSLSLALVFFQSFWYLRNYLAKDAYDNIYITKQFKALDTDCERNGRPNVLPLKNKEKGTYVDTSSIKLNTAELVYCKIGLAQVLLHFLLCVLVLLFDYTLYYILELVRKYGVVDFVFGGQSRVIMTVSGNGPVADFYKTVVDGIQLDQTYNTSFKTIVCLPDPSEPSVSTLPVLFVLYLVALLFVLLRGYGMRLRRKISAYYYPEQEKMRLDYLHKKIRHKRVGFIKFLRQQIKSSNKENAVKESLRLSTWLAFTFPCLEGLLAQHSKLECTSCEQTEHSFSDVRLTRCKGVSGGVQCDAVYCQDCWEELKGVCPLCSGQDEVELRD